MNIVLFLLALASATFADTSAFTERQFAQSRFRFTRPSVVRMRVQTCNSNGQVKEIKLRVTEGTLDLNSLDLFYESGEKERMGGFTLEKGQASDWLPLAFQDNPCLTFINLNVNARAGSPATTVHVIGQWIK